MQPHNEPSNEGKVRVTLFISGFNYCRFQTTHKVLRKNKQIYVLAKFIEYGTIKY